MIKASPVTPRSAFTNPKAPRSSGSCDQPVAAAGDVAIPATPILAQPHPRGANQAFQHSAHQTHRGVSVNLADTRPDRRLDPNCATIIVQGQLITIQSQFCRRLHRSPKVFGQARKSHIKGGQEILRAGKVQNQIARDTARCGRGSIDRKCHHHRPR